MIYGAWILLWPFVSFLIQWPTVSFRGLPQPIFLLSTGLCFGISGLGFGGFSAAHFMGEPTFALGSLLVGIAGFFLFFASGWIGTARRKAKQAANGNPAGNGEVSA